MQELSSLSLVRDPSPRDAGTHHPGQAFPPQPNLSGDICIDGPRDVFLNPVKVTVKICQDSHDCMSVITGVREPGHR